jgi:hypothetical protein
MPLNHPAHRGTKFQNFHSRKIGIVSEKLDWIPEVAGNRRERRAAAAVKRKGRNKDQFADWELRGEPIKLSEK